jgi:hypothetical protein
MVSMKIEKGTAKNKKWKAIFYDAEAKDRQGRSVRKKIKTTQFGDNRFEDYTQHKDKKRRSKYRDRHKKDLDKGDYMSAGFLSYYLLWGESTSLKTNISNYKKKFKLK